MARNYAAEYGARKARATERGLSPGAGRGHPRAGEPTAKALDRVAKGKGSIADLRMAALANYRKQFGADAQKKAEKHSKKIRDKRTLEEMRKASAAEWREKAARQEPGNPWHYHWK